MIEWLRKPPAELPTIAVGERLLPVAIRRDARARRMTMRLAPDGSEVRITVPRWGRSAEALAFARERTDWLARQLSVVPERGAFGDGATLPLDGIPLTIRHDPATRRQPRIGEGELHVGGPAESLGTRTTRWLREQARQRLAEDLAHYCLKANVRTPRLLLSSAQRRWGSCAGDGTIRVNWRLVMAPPSVRRSVVAHEVAHLVHFDHSPAFHALLGAIYEDDIRAANRWLKAHGRGLYASLG